MSYFVIVYFAYTGVQNEVRCLPILVYKTKSDVDQIIWIQKMSNIQVDILSDNFKSVKPDNVHSNYPGLKVSFRISVVQIIGR